MDHLQNGNKIICCLSVVILNNLDYFNSRKKLIEFFLFQYFRLISLIKLISVTNFGQISICLLHLSYIWLINNLLIFQEQHNKITRRNVDYFIKSLV